jgi:hypothetical protein
MARKPRDYKAEYAARTAKATREGYQGYSHKRKVSEHNQKVVDRMIERMNESGWDWTEMDDNDPLYWEWFRLKY